MLDFHHCKADGRTIMHTGIHSMELPMVVACLSVLKLHIIVAAIPSVLTPLNLKR